MMRSGMLICVTIVALANVKTNQATNENENISSQTNNEQTGGYNLKELFDDGTNGTFFQQTGSQKLASTNPSIKEKDTPKLVKEFENVSDKEDSTKGSYISWLGVYVPKGGNIMETEINDLPDKTTPSLFEQDGVYLEEMIDNVTPINELDESNKTALTTSMVDIAQGMYDKFFKSGQNRLRKSPDKADQELSIDPQDINSEPIEDALDTFLTKAVYLYKGKPYLDSENDEKTKGNIIVNHVANLRNDKSGSYSKKDMGTEENTESSTLSLDMQTTSIAEHEPESIRPRKPTDENIEQVPTEIGSYIFYQTTYKPFTARSGLFGTSVNGADSTTKIPKSQDDLGTVTTTSLLQNIPDIVTTEYKTQSQDNSDIVSENIQPLDNSDIVLENTQPLGQPTTVLKSTQRLDNSDIVLENTQQLDSSDKVLENTQQLDNSDTVWDNIEPLGQSDLVLDSSQPNEQMDVLLDDTQTEDQVDTGNLNNEVEENRPRIDRNNRRNGPPRDRPRQRYRPREPRPRQNEPRPRQNEPRPMQNEPRPRQNEPRPRQNEPRPRQYEPIPRQNEPRPRQNEPRPRTREPISLQNEPRPRENEPRPRQNEPRPRPREPRPRQNGPRPRQNEPRPRQDEPITRQNEPIPRQNGPRPRQNEPRPGSREQRPRTEHTEINSQRDTLQNEESPIINDNSGTDSTVLPLNNARQTSASSSQVENVLNDADTNDNTQLQHSDTIDPQILSEIDMEADSTHESSIEENIAAPSENSIQENTPRQNGPRPRQNEPRPRQDGPRSRQNNPMPRQREPRPRQNEPRPRPRGPRQRPLPRQRPRNSSPREQNDDIPTVEENSEQEPELDPDSLIQNTNDQISARSDQAENVMDVVESTDDSDLQFVSQLDTGTQQTRDSSTEENISDNRQNNQNNRRDGPGRNMLRPGPRAPRPRPRNMPLREQNDIGSRRMDDSNDDDLQNQSDSLSSREDNRNLNQRGRQMERERTRSQQSPGPRRRQKRQVSDGSEIKFYSQLDTMPNIIQPDQYHNLASYDSSDTRQEHTNMLRPMVSQTVGEQSKKYYQTSEQPLNMQDVYDTESFDNVADILWEGENMNDNFKPIQDYNMDIPQSPMDMRDLYGIQTGGQYVDDYASQEDTNMPDVRDMPIQMSGAPQRSNVGGLDSHEARMNNGDGMKSAEDSFQKYGLLNDGMTVVTPSVFNQESDIRQLPQIPSHNIRTDAYLDENKISQVNAEMESAKLNTDRMVPLQQITSYENTRVERRFEEAGNMVIQNNYIQQNERKYVFEKRFIIPDDFAFETIIDENRRMSFYENRQPNSIVEPDLQSLLNNDMRDRPLVPSATSFKVEIPYQSSGNNYKDIVRSPNEYEASRRLPNEYRNMEAIAMDLRQDPYYSNRFESVLGAVSGHGRYENNRITPQMNIRSSNELQQPRNIERSNGREKPSMWNRLKSMFTNPNKRNSRRRFKSNLGNDDRIRSQRKGTVSGFIRKFLSIPRKNSRRRGNRGRE